MLEVKNVRIESKNLTHEFNSSLDTKRRENYWTMRKLVENIQIGAQREKNTEKRIRDTGCSKNISYMCV